MHGLTCFTSTIGHYFSWWNLETPLTRIKTNKRTTVKNSSLMFEAHIPLTMQLNAHVLIYKGGSGVDFHCCPSLIHPRAGKSGLCAFGVVLLAPGCELCFFEVSTHSALPVSVQVQGKRYFFGPGTIVPSREGGMLWQVWPAGPAGRWCITIMDRVLLHNHTYWRRCLYTGYIVTHLLLCVFFFGRLWFFLWLVLLTLFFFLLIFLKSGVSYMKLEMLEWSKGISQTFLTLVFLL